MNPCPCGYLTDPDRDCICTPTQVTNYRGRLSGPLIDRIDMYIEVPKVPTKDFQDKNLTQEETSENIKNRVQFARDIQLRRFIGTPLKSNSEMRTSDIKKYCIIDPEGESILMQAVSSMKLSARAYYRILKLSRTIADLENSDMILTSHILEAFSYRKKEE